MENRTLGPTKSIPPCSKNLELVFWVLNGTAGVIILSGNFITILVLVTNRRLRQNYVNIFLVNLAVADLMMAVFVIPGSRSSAMAAINTLYQSIVGSWLELKTSPSVVRCLIWLRYRSTGSSPFYGLYIITTT